MNIEMLLNTSDQHKKENENTTLYRKAKYLSGIQEV